jgi:hypothetical protein
MIFLRAFLVLSIILFPLHAGAQSPESKVLETTTIEGQILFPKVLFISAEDPTRYPETLHRSYLRTALQLASAVRVPERITAPVRAVYAPPSAAAESTLVPNPNETSSLPRR